ncbi:hypothetical protein, partial [Bacillus licheniformis]|uniref:hypothetical protein n=1 Tax=Bacillus licheniformis TaxID=1402 RepID=UPI00203DCC37
MGVGWVDSAGHGLRFGEVARTKVLAEGMKSPGRQSQKEAPALIKKRSGLNTTPARPVELTALAALPARPTMLFSPRRSRVAHRGCRMDRSANRIFISY